MTNLAVNENDPLIQYTSTGETTFAYDFPIRSTDEIKVSVDQVEKTHATDYTLTGVGDASGGNVVFTTATTSGEVITFWLDKDIKRETGFSEGAATILPDDLNTEFADIIRDLQMLRRDVRRSIHLAPDDATTATDMELPPHSTTASQYIIRETDGSLGLVTEQLDNTVALTGALLGSYLFPIAAAETAEAITPSSYLYPVGDVRRYGAIEGTSADSKAAITTCFNLCRDYDLPFLMSGTYRIDSGLTFNGGSGTGYTTCIFDRAIIKKNFDGAGLTCSGGSYFQIHNGMLTITKMSNVATGDGTGATAGDYGFVQNCRIMRNGTLIINGQQDDGYYIQADTNMNGCDQGIVRSENNNGKGFGGTGTQDDNAVWTGRWDAIGNYEAGIEFADTFLPRAWNMTWRAENNAQDGTSDQVYTGGMNHSFIVCYPEETAVSTGVELHVPAASTYNEIYLTRVNTITQASTTTNVYRGSQQYLTGSVVNEASVVAQSLSDDVAKTLTKTWKGSADTTLYERVITGNGTVAQKTTGRTSSDVLSTLYSPDDGTKSLQLNGTTVQQETDTGSLLLLEKAAADADSAAYGQLWVENSVPCRPRFTGDTGVDYQIAMSDGTTGGAASAGAGNQYVEIEIGGTTYKVLHDGTV